MQSHRFQPFGHGNGHVLKQLCKTLSLPPELRTHVKLFTTMDSPGVWFTWVGSNGERYKHRFDDWPGNMDDDEFNALRVKVRLSTC